MKAKNTILMSCFVLLVLAMVSPLTRVYIDEPIVNGQENEMYVLVQNTMTKSLEKCNVRMFIQEIGEVVQSYPFVLEGRSNEIVRLEWMPMGVEPGTYTARVEFWSPTRNVKDWQYIDIEVV